MANEQSQTLALLIDGDNASSKIVGGLLAEIANYGTASVKRIYGDWTKPNLSGWKDYLLEHSIQPVQQFAYTTGKNATDGAMIIDAMDLLYTGRFSGFCIVSSDMEAAEKGYASPFWMTYKQASELGGQVRKGERSTLVVKYGVVEKEGEAGEEVRRPYLRAYHASTLENDGS